MDFHKIWQEQCAATRTIRERIMVRMVDRENSS